MAIFTHLRVQDFGCFASAELQLSPLTVLVGPNDSGKTTLLRAVLFHWAFITCKLGQPSRRLEELLRMPMLRRASAQKGPCELAIMGPQLSLTQRWPDNSIYPHDYYRYADRPGLTPTAQNILSRIALYRLNPSALRAPSAPADGEQVPQLAEDGAGLPTVLSVIAGADLQAAQRIQTDFTRAVPTLAGYRVLPTPERGHRLVFRLRDGGQDIEAAQVSDGALLFLAYLSLLHRPDPPSVILLEEPENGVHPSRLREILRLLRVLTQPGEGREATQVILTTHSPYLLDEARPEEVFFCRRGKDGVATAHRFDTLPKLEQRLADYSLGELWTALGEEELYRLVTSSA